jgi:hypothetical protein
MKLIIALWRRFWHCFAFIFKTDEDHRMLTGRTKFKGKNLILYLGCSCGKIYYKILPCLNCKQLTNHTNNDKCDKCIAIIPKPTGVYEQADSLKNIPATDHYCNVCGAVSQNTMLCNNIICPTNH